MLSQDRAGIEEGVVSIWDKRNIGRWDPGLASGGSGHNYCGCSGRDRPCLEHPGGVEVIPHDSLGDVAISEAVYLELMGGEVTEDGAWENLRQATIGKFNVQFVLILMGRQEKISDALDLGQKTK